MAKKADYSEAVAERIIELVSEGMSLVDAAQQKGIPSRTTIYKWLDANEDFANRYARASEIRAHRLADDVISISDEEADPQRTRNRMEARKWAASKMYPKVYGDKTTIAGTGDKDDAIHIDSTSALEQIISRLTRLAAREAED